MTDPRRVTHPGQPGLPSAAGLPRPPHVVVVGAGIAGLAAAAGLVERGVTVEVLERETNLGGRLRAAGRQRGGRQPGIPCLLQAVLQPEGATAPQ